MTQDTNRNIFWLEMYNYDYRLSRFFFSEKMKVHQKHMPDYAIQIIF